MDLEILLINSNNNNDKNLSICWHLPPTREDSSSILKSSINMFLLKIETDKL